jgi:isocitrate/isopropylmalate dehydrogenase
VLELVSKKSLDFDLKLESHQFGGCAIDAFGEPLPASTLAACQEADAILMGECTINLSRATCMVIGCRVYWRP